MLGKINVSKLIQHQLKSLELISFKLQHSERFRSQKHNPGIAGTPLSHESAFHYCQRPNPNARCLRDLVPNHL